MPKQLIAPAGGPSIVLRPLYANDEEQWSQVHWRNSAWLEPWESGDPTHSRGISFNEWIQRQRRSEQEGTGAVFAIEYQMRIVGQISIGAITYGSMRTGIVGYWVDEQVAGCGFAPMAVALVADWAMHNPAGPCLHRIEIAILPENKRSQRVAEKLRAHEEGIRVRYMYVNNRWRDHLTYSLLAEDSTQSFATALLADTPDANVGKMY